VDYAVQVLCTLADAGRTMTSRELSASLGLPHKFLEAVLTDLRRGGILTSRRGVAGGYGLARTAGAISLHDVTRSLVGTLTEVRGQPPDSVDYRGSAEHLRVTWLTVGATVQSVLEGVTIADVVAGDLSRARGAGAGVGTVPRPAVG
jgi:Rrf2 family protein